MCWEHVSSLGKHKYRGKETEGLFAGVSGLFARDPCAGNIVSIMFAVFIECATILS